MTIENRRGCARTLVRRTLPPPLIRLTRCGQTIISAAPLSTHQLTNVLRYPTHRSVRQGSAPWKPSHCHAAGGPGWCRPTSPASSALFSSLPASPIASATSAATGTNATRLNISPMNGERAGWNDTVDRVRRVGLPRRHDLEDGIRDGHWRADAEAMAGHAAGSRHRRGRGHRRTKDCRRLRAGLSRLAKVLRRQ